MSKPTRKSSKSKPKTATRRKLGHPMKGCEILVAALERENVDTISPTQALSLIHI